MAGVLRPVRIMVAVGLLLCAEGCAERLHPAPEELQVSVADVPDVVRVRHILQITSRGCAAVGVGAVINTNTRGPKR